MCEDGCCGSYFLTLTMGRLFTLKLVHNTTHLCQPTVTSTKEPADEMSGTDMQEISNSTHLNTTDERLSNKATEIISMNLEQPFVNIFQSNKSIPGSSTDQPSAQTIIFSANVGPSGIRDSILHLLPLFGAAGGAAGVLDDDRNGHLVNFG